MRVHLLRRAANWVPDDPATFDLDAFGLYEVRRVLRSPAEGRSGI